MTRVAVQTLGCKLNYAESSTIAERFSREGFELVPECEPTDVFILNTCSVTENAEKECRQIIRRTLRHSPNAFVAVIGCYAQLRPGEVAAISGVDAVFGGVTKWKILENITSFEKREHPLVLATEYPESLVFHTAATATNDVRTRAFLKVQDGCDYSCSYCTIPEARGRSRSGTVGQVVEEAIRLSDDGFHEIVLTGVNVGDFGVGSGETLYSLLHALEIDEQVTARLRISSIEPNLLTEEIIRLVASSTKWCPHFHIPLQSGSPKILRLMRRRYNRELYSQRIRLIKRLLPDAAIGVDVIVGFPGESRNDFQETVDYLANLDISYLHVFTYSERPGTVAASLPNEVDIHERRERNHILRQLSAKKQHAFYHSQVGRELQLVLEEPTTSDGWVHGYSENYVRMRVQNSAHAELVIAKLESIQDGIGLGTVTQVIAESSPSSLLPIL